MVDTFAKLSCPAPATLNQLLDGNKRAGNKEKKKGKCGFEKNEMSYHTKMMTELSRQDR
jgi:hypothetical protein